MPEVVFINNYTPVGDIISICLCWVVIVLIQASYVSKKKSFMLFSGMVFLVMFASFSDIIYHYLLAREDLVSYTPIYIFRFTFHAFLFAILFLYIWYIVEVQQIEINKRKIFMVLSLIGFLIVNAADLISTINGSGFRVNGVNNVSEHGQIFMYGYIFFVAIIIYLMIRYRKRLYAQVMAGFYGTMIISFLVLFLQDRFSQSSFTTITFVFPIISMLYLIHSNPYDLSIGAVSINAFEDLVKYYYKRNREFVLMSLYLGEFDHEGLHFPEEIRSSIRKFTSSFFRGAVLFQISNGHVVLIAG